MTPTEQAIIEQTKRVAKAMREGFLPRCVQHGAVGPMDLTASGPVCALCRTPMQLSDSPHAYNYGPCEVGR